MDESTPGGWWVSTTSGGFLTGTPTAGETTYLRLRATYTDTLTYSSSSIYKITVTNTAPTLSVAVADQTAVVGSAFSFGFTSSVFTDSDSGDSLTFSSTQGSGIVLPDWLIFDAENKLYSGTPTSVTTYTIKVTATDLGGRSASDNFQLVVTNNDPISVSGVISDQNLVVGEEFEYNIPSGAFTDADSHTITYLSSTQTDLSALPSWIDFKSNSGIFSGTPTASGTISVRITATDGYGGTNPTIDMNFVVNSRPTTTGYTDLLKTTGDVISVVTPFTDADGDTLTYSAVMSNGSSTITPFSLSSAGLLEATFTSTGMLTIIVTATDPSSNSVSSTQTVVVNAPPVVDQTKLTDLYSIGDQYFSYLTLPTGTFVDTDTLTYSLDGTSTNTAGFTFDPEGPKIYGATTNSTSAALVIIATDTEGQTASANLNITVGNSFSIVANTTIPNQTIKSNMNFSIAFSDIVFYEASGTPFQMIFGNNTSGGSMPSWWSYNSITRVASGKAPIVNSDDVSTIQVTGGTSTNTTTFTLTVSANNNPAVTSNCLSDMTVYQEIAFKVQFEST